MRKFKYTNPRTGKPVKITTEVSKIPRKRRSDYGTRRGYTLEELLERNK